MNRQEAAASIKKKIETAYSERGLEDYPPFRYLGFEDRPVYHAFILKLIDEWAKE